MVLVPAGPGRHRSAGPGQGAAGPGGLWPLLRHHGAQEHDRDHRLHLSDGPCGLQRLHQKPHRRGRTRASPPGSYKDMTRVAWLAPADVGGALPGKPGLPAAGAGQLHGQSDSSTGTPWRRTTSEQPGAAAGRGPQTQGGGGRTMTYASMSRASRAYDVADRAAACWTGLGRARRRRSPGPGPPPSLVSDDDRLSPVRRARRSSRWRRRASASCLLRAFPRGGGEQEPARLTAGFSTSWAENHLTRSDFWLPWAAASPGTWRASPPPPICGACPSCRCPRTPAGGGGLLRGRQDRQSTCPTGKNQAGCFYQPLPGAVRPGHCCRTLPEREYRGGCAEVIKYGVLFDEAFFARSGGQRRSGTRWSTSSPRCVALKRGRRGGGRVRPGRAGHC